MIEARTLVSVMVALWVSACSLDNPGREPPAGQLNFPIALELSPGSPPRFLLLANSNFDLRYNGGSLQVFDLEALETLLPACDGCALDPAEDGLLRAEVVVGSHVSGLALSPAGDRVYLAVRSDLNLTFVDVSDSGSLSCGGRGQRQRCADAFRRGDEAVASERNISLPTDPVGLVAGSLDELGLVDGGDYVLMGHRPGRVSLFLDKAEGVTDAPVLVHVVGDLPEGLVNIQMEPGTGLAWLPSSSGDRIARVGIALDARSRDLLRSFVYDAGAVTLRGVDDGRDTRDIGFGAGPDGKRRAYVLARRPEALLVADIDDATPFTMDVTDAIAVGYGPSRMAVTELDVGGTPRTFVLVSCFDSRDIYIIDPAMGQTVSVIRGMSGPFEVAVDPARALVYIADFRASVVRVATLRPLLDCLNGAADATSCEPRVVATIGTPNPVGELL